MMHKDTLRTEIINLTDRCVPELEDLYKFLHQYPELSCQEVRTSARIVKELTDIGIDVHHGIGGHGLVGILDNGPGNCLLIRADMDALPLRERTGLPYSSNETAELDGREVHVMHACGHDLHCACLVGAARILAGIKNRWQGRVLFVGQPAEETIGGAALMMQDDIYSRFGRPDACLALHVDPFIPAGSVSLSPGVQSSCNHAVDLTVYGIGGHGASPHHTKDPIVLAAHIITALQTVVSRELNPRDMGLITVGSIHGGTKRNIIPDKVELSLTIRAYEKTLADYLLEAVNRTAKGLARSYGLPEELMPEIRMPEPSFPPVVNDPHITAKVDLAFKDLLGEDRVLAGKPSTGSEDFSFFGETVPPVPILMYHLGVTDARRLHAANKKGETLVPLHDPAFAPDLHPSLATGVTTMSWAALNLLADTEGDADV